MKNKRNIKYIVMIIYFLMAIAATIMTGFMSNARLGMIIIVLMLLAFVIPLLNWFFLEK